MGKTPAKGNILSYLRKHSLETPQKAAYVFLDENGDLGSQITYSQLYLRVSHLATHLINRQRRGKRALLVYDNILEFIICFLACQYVGIIAVPVSISNRSKSLRRLTDLVEDAGIQTIFSTFSLQSFLEKAIANHYLNKIEIISTDFNNIPERDYVVSEAKNNKIAFIQYTSGSTGKPKGVIISPQNLIENQKLLKNTFKCDQHSIIFSWLPFHHDMGLIGNILHAIYVGCSCILVSPFYFFQKPRRWLDAISRYRVTHTGGPNFAYDLCKDKVSLTELEKIDLSSWKVAYNGSEPVRAETIIGFANYFKQCGFEMKSFYPCYGLAESTLLVSGQKGDISPTIITIDGLNNKDGYIKLSNSSTHHSTNIVSSGYIAEGLDVKIISPTGYHECVELEEGEICVNGTSVTKGYWNKMTKDTFFHIKEKQYFRTGDLGFFYDGELFVHGRIKELLIVRGKNYYPYDLEKFIFEYHPCIETNGVVVFDVKTLSETFVVIAEVKRTEIKKTDLKAVIRSIERVIVSEYGITPSDIVLTPPLGIPRTTSGKLQRLLCENYYSTNTLNVIASKKQLSNSKTNKVNNDQLAKNVLIKRTRNSINIYVKHIINFKTGNAQALSLSEDTTLTDVGIDSLKAMELINLINKDLGINIEASIFFHDNTLFSLLNTMENMLWLKNESDSANEIIL